MRLIPGQGTKIPQSRPLRKQASLLHSQLLWDVVWKIKIWLYRSSPVTQLVKNLPAVQESWVRTLGWEDPLEKGKAYLLQYSGLENSMDCIVHEITKSWTRLSDFHSHYNTGNNFSSVQLLSHVQLFVTPWPAAHQASLSITNSWSFLKLMSIESVMPSNHLILCCPLFFLPSIFPSLRVFSNESVLHIRWLKYWSFSFNNLNDPIKGHESNT